MYCFFRFPRFYRCIVGSPHNFFVVLGFWGISFFQAMSVFNSFTYYLKRLSTDVACIQSDDRANVNLFKSFPINLNYEDYNVSLGRS